MAGLATVVLPASVALASPPVSFPSASVVSLSRVAENVELDGMACAADGDCVAVGKAVNQKRQGEGAVVVPQTATGWSASKVPLPSGSVLSGADDLTSASCVNPGSCYAVGVYEDQHHDLLPLVESDAVDGSWQLAGAVQLPSGAEQSPAVAGLAGVSCVGDGSCLGVGAFVAGNGYRQAMAAFVAGSGSGAAVEVRPPPSEKNPDALLTAVSCTSGGSCLAVGNYTGQAGQLAGMAVGESDGQFGTAVPVEPPPGLASGGVRLTGVSCVSVGTCVVSGEFYWKVARSFEPMVASESGGSWQSSIALHMPTNRAVRPQGAAQGVWCVSSASCVVVGTYRTTPDADAMLVQEVGGSWKSGVELGTPGEGTSGIGATMAAIACRAPGQCGIAGFAIGGSASSINGLVALSTTDGSYVPLPAPTNLSLSASPGAVGAGDPISLSATVSSVGTQVPQSGVGTVTFTITGSQYQPSYVACSAQALAQVQAGVVVAVATCQALAPEGGTGGVTVVADFPGDEGHHSAVVSEHLDDMGFHRVRADPDGDLYDVSCPTASFCAAIDRSSPEKWCSRPITVTAQPHAKSCMTD